MMALGLHVRFPTLSLDFSENKFWTMKHSRRVSLAFANIQDREKALFLPEVQLDVSVIISILIPIPIMNDSIALYFNLALFAISSFVFFVFLLLFAYNNRRLFELQSSMASCVFDLQRYQ
jgi:hypothetical protein